MPQETVISVDL